MHDMKRMQVLFDHGEYARYQEAARRAGLTMAAWVREALRAAVREAPLGDRDRKLEAIRAAARHTHPTADIEQVLAEIERGYTGSDAS